MRIYIDPTSCVTAARNSRNHTQRSHSTHRRERHRTETIALIFPWNSCPRGQRRERERAGQTSEKEERNPAATLSRSPKRRDVALRLRAVSITKERARARRGLRGREKSALCQSVAPRNCVVENLPNGSPCMQWRPVSPRTSRSQSRSHGRR